MICVAFATLTLSLTLLASVCWLGCLRWEEGGREGERAAHSAGRGQQGSGWGGPAIGGKIG